MTTLPADKGYHKLLGKLIHLELNLKSNTNVLFFSFFHSRHFFTLWAYSRQTENKEFLKINHIPTNCVKTQISVPINVTH